MLSAIVAASLATPSVAQPVLEVASIKPNRSGDEVGRVVVSGGLFRATNVTVRYLIALSFGNGRALFTDQISGGPDWIGSARFDVIAKADPSVRDLRTAAPAIRELLADRFQLRAHPEERSLPVYHLVRARPDGLGPSIRPSAIDCTATPRPPGCGSTFGDGSIEATGYPIPLLIAALSANVERLVIDQTGLSGLFDLSLKWNPNPTALADDRPSLFTAVEEQLGLRLDARRSPVEVLVIDAVSQPVAN